MALRSSSLTPQFTWDSATGQYRNRQGRFVPRTAVRTALDEYLDNKSAYVRTLAEQLRDRTISLPAWQREMERTVAKIHLASVAVAKGGWAQMEYSDYGRVGALVKQELNGLKGVHRGLRGIAIDIESGKIPLDGRFLNRMRQYAQAGRHSYHTVEAMEMQARGMDEVRSIRHAGDSCAGCIAEANKGWRSIGEILLPGTRDCLRNCRCTLQYRNSTTGDVI